MSDGNDFWLGLESVYNLLIAVISIANTADLRGDTTDFRLDLGDLGAIGLETAFSLVK